MSKLETFHDAISRGDFGSIKSLLSEDMTLINGVNEQGLFPLHQACFRGHLEIIDFLLKNGADVNACDRKQGYTALMFAAITGNLGITELLLHHGARSADVNKVNRTAAQLAAFVGNHHISTFINNFLEKSEIDQYTVPKIPATLRLDSNVAAALYRLLLNMNITPVKVLLCLCTDGANLTNSSMIRAGCILNHWHPVVNVLEELLQKYFTPHQTHESLALKFHMLACLLRKAGEFIEQASADLPVSDGNSSDGPLFELIKEFLKGTKPHGLPLGQEKFIRRALLSFPHRESMLWRQLMTQVSKVQPGYSPTALSFLECAINGQGPFGLPQGDSVTDWCSTCGDRGKQVEIKLCHNCKEVGYCSVACQRIHWFTHKKYCPILRAHHDACDRSRKEATAQSVS